jgi:hypothetical protein
MSQAPVRLLVAVTHDEAREQLAQQLPQLGYDVAVVDANQPDYREQINALTYLSDLVITDRQFCYEEITTIFLQRRVEPAFLRFVTNGEVPQPQSDCEYILNWYDWPLPETMMGLVIQTSLQFRKRIRSLELEVKDLKQKVEDRKIIEQAADVLQDRFGKSREDTWEYLTHCVTSRGISRIAFARNLLAADDWFYPFKKENKNCS